MTSIITYFNVFLTNDDHYIKYIYFSDENLASVTKENIDLMKDQLQKLSDDNKTLKEQSRHVGSQLDIALLQVSFKSKNIFVYNNLFAIH